MKMFHYPHDVDNFALARSTFFLGLLFFVQMPLTSPAVTKMEKKAAESIARRAGGDATKATPESSTPIDDEEGLTVSSTPAYGSVEPSRPPESEVEVGPKDVGEVTEPGAAMAVDGDVAEPKSKNSTPIDDEEGLTVSSTPAYGSVEPSRPPESEVEVGPKDVGEVTEPAVEPGAAMAVDGDVAETTPKGSTPIDDEEGLTVSSTPAYGSVEPSRLPESEIEVGLKDAVKATEPTAERPLRRARDRFFKILGQYPACVPEDKLERFVFYDHRPYLRSHDPTIVTWAALYDIVEPYDELSIKVDFFKVKILGVDDGDNDSDRSKYPLFVTFTARDVYGLWAYQAPREIHKNRAARIGELMNDNNKLVAYHLDDGAYFGYDRNGCLRNRRYPVVFGACGDSAPVPLDDLDPPRGKHSLVIINAYGKIEFDEPLDVRAAMTHARKYIKQGWSDVFQIDNLGVNIYRTAGRRGVPAEPKNAHFNRPAKITIFRLHDNDGRLFDRNEVNRFKDVKTEAYDPQTGRWVFRQVHFSRAGVPPGTPAARSRCPPIRFPLASVPLPPSALLAFPEFAGQSRGGSAILVPVETPDHRRAAAVVIDQLPLVHSTEPAALRLDRGWQLHVAPRALLTTVSHFGHCAVPAVRFLAGADVFQPELLRLRLSDRGLSVRDINDAMVPGWHFRPCPQFENQLSAVLPAAGMFLLGGTVRAQDGGLEPGLDGARDSSRHWWAYDGFRRVFFLGDGSDAIVLEPHDLDGSREQVDDAARQRYKTARDDDEIRSWMAARRVQDMIRLRDLNVICVLARETGGRKRRNDSDESARKRQKNK